MTHPVSSPGATRAARAGARARSDRGTDVATAPSMARRTALGLAGLLLLALPALADGLEEAKLTRSRGLTAITAHGALAAPPAGALVARLRRDDRVALEAPVELRDGRVQVELLTAQLLLAGRYVVEVGPPGAPALLSAPLAVGTDEEAAAAATRLDGWYRAARGTLRDLAAALDRRGRFHLAQLQALAAPEEKELHRARFGEFLDAWSAGLRAARMDLATFERRLLLPCRPAAAEALRDVVAALDARALAWKEALARPGAAAPSDAALRAAAGALLAALGLDAATLADWQAGPLAAPPPGSPAGTGVVAAAQGGVYADPAGFRLPLPPGFEALPADQRPEERVILRLPDPAGGDAARLLVQVQPLPDATTGEALAAAVEVSAWETFLSYKRLSSAPEAGGVRIEFEAVEPRGGAKVRVIQWSRWTAKGGQVVHALLVRPAGAPAPAQVEQLVAGGFAAVDP